MVCGKPIRLCVWLGLAVAVSVSSAALRAQQTNNPVCPRPLEGDVVQDAPEIASKGGFLELTLHFKSALERDGKRTYCFVSDSGIESPTLRLLPGDRLSLHLRNEVSVERPGAEMDGMAGMKAHPSSASQPCGGEMTGFSTNLHFHGLGLPPVCHQDESIHTLVGPGESFDYDLRIPKANPPGLYWYHPHPHGISQGQVQGGASGALIVEGIQTEVRALASLRERTFVLRDQLLSGAVEKADTSTPSWDVSLNYVPVRYPAYVPARIEVMPGERQFWRFVNAAANTIFNLQVVYGGVAQALQVYAVDGVPLSGAPAAQTAVYLPPGSRVEFTVKTPSSGQTAQLITTRVDSGPTGDSAPARPIADIVARAVRRHGRETVRAQERGREAAEAPRSNSLSAMKPVRTRNLYFSQNGNGTEGGTGAATKFYITVLGQRVQSFDMAAAPNIVANQGTVEDWNIQNTTPEDHIFHIHQVHFQLIAVNGIPVADPTIRDTIRVPHQVGRTPISSVKLRMDFRDPDIVGTFVYHCHILDHEDRGMMGSIQVLPAAARAGGVGAGYPR